MVIRICFLFVTGYDIGCVSEARMNVARCMEEKIKNGIQYLRYVGPAQLDDNLKNSHCHHHVWLGNTIQMVCVKNFQCFYQL